MKKETSPPCLGETEQASGVKVGQVPPTERENGSGSGGGGDGGSGGGSGNGGSGGGGDGGGGDGGSGGSGNGGSGGGGDGGSGGGGDGGSGGGGGGGGSGLSTGGESIIEFPTALTDATSSAGELLPSSPVYNHTALVEEVGSGTSLNFPTGTQLHQPPVSTFDSSMLPTHAWPTTLPPFGGSTRKLPAPTGLAGISSSTRPQPVPSTAQAVKTVAALGSPTAPTAPDRPVFKIVDVVLRATL